MADEEMVVVTFVRAHGPYMPKDTAGFPPAVASVLIAKKIAVPYGAVEQRAPDAPAPVPVVPPLEADIPEDWETMHHLPLIALAKQIKPSHEGKMTKDEAVEVIKTELERRAAAEL